MTMYSGAALEMKSSSSASSFSGPLQLCRQNIFDEIMFRTNTEGSQVHTAIRR
uniref:Uncharacterized protein n=2 Tax=Poecilia TaxID=8080 RepID=A0A3B3UI23_9TELE